jgi:hypothetical protein
MNTALKILTAFGIAFAPVMAIAQTTTAAAPATASKSDIVTPAKPVEKKTAAPATPAKTEGKKAAAPAAKTN